MDCFRKKHGGAKRGHEERLYHVWNDMKQRCTIPIILNIYGTVQRALQYVMNGEIIFRSRSGHMKMAMMIKHQKGNVR